MQGQNDLETMNLNQTNYQQIMKRLKQDLSQELKSKAGLENLLEASLSGKAKLDSKHKEAVHAQLYEANSRIEDLQEEINELNICVWSPSTETSKLNQQIEKQFQNSNIPNNAGNTPNNNSSQILSGASTSTQNSGTTVNSNNSVTSPGSYNHQLNDTIEQIKALEKQLAIEKKVERGAKTMMELYRINQTSSSKKLLIDAEQMLIDAQTKVSIIEVRLVKAKRERERLEADQQKQQQQQNENDIKTNSSSSNLPDSSRNNNSSKNNQSSKSSHNNNNSSSTSSPFQQVQHNNNNIPPPAAFSDNNNSTASSTVQTPNTTSTTALSNSSNLNNLNNNQTTPTSTAAAAANNFTPKQLTNEQQIDLIRNHLRLEWDILVGTERLLQVHQMSMKTQLDKSERKDKNEQLFEVQEKYSVSSDRLDLLKLALQQRVCKLKAVSPPPVEQVGDEPVIHAADKKTEIMKELEILSQPSSKGQLTSKLLSPIGLSSNSVSSASPLSGSLEIRLYGISGLLERIEARAERAETGNISDILLPNHNNEVKSSSNFFSLNKKSESNSRKSVKLKSMKNSKSKLLDDESKSEQISCVLRLDNEVVGQTGWTNVANQKCWDQQFNLTLEKNREMSVEVYWRDWRSMAAIKFLRLEDLVDDNHQSGMPIEMEPQGILYADIKFLNPRIERSRRKLARQKRLFNRKGKFRNIFDIFSNFFEILPSASGSLSSYPNPYAQLYQLDASKRGGILVDKLVRIRSKNGYNQNRPRVCVCLKFRTIDSCIFRERCSPSGTDEH